MPAKPRADDRRFSPLEARETSAAARAAAAIGGPLPDPELDPAQRPLAEAGGGVAEGFELAEQELIEAAEHGDSAADPLADAFTAEHDRAPLDGLYGEADHEDSSELRNSDR